MKLQKRLFLTFAFLALVLISLVISNSISFGIKTINTNGTLNISQLETDNQYEIKSRYYILDHIADYNEIREIEGEDRVLSDYNRLDFTIDQTLYLEISNATIESYSFVFKDLSNNYKFFVDDQLIHTGTTSNKVNYFTISQDGGSYFFIFQSFKTNQSTNNFLSSQYIIKTAKPFFLNFFPSDLILMLSLLFSSILLFIYFLTSREEVYIIPLIATNLLALFITPIDIPILNRLDVPLNEFVVFTIRIISILLIAFTVRLFATKRKMQIILPFKYEGIAFSILLVSSMLLFHFDIDISFYINIIIGLYILTYIIFNSTSDSNLTLGILILMFSPVFGILTSHFASYYNISQSVYSYQINRYSLAVFTYVMSFLIYIFAYRFIRVKKIDTYVYEADNRSYHAQKQLNEQIRILNRQVLDLTQKVDNLSTNKDYMKNLLLNISHDLRTPIAVVDGYLQVISDLNDDKDVKEKYYQRMNSKLEYLQKLINDLFLLARVETGSLNLVLEEINLTKFANSLIEDYIPFAKQVNRVLTTSLTNDDFIAEVDIKQFPRIIDNIITNSIKYTLENQGEIEVSTRIINNHFEIIVKDNGIGIDKLDLANIFNEYYRNKRSSIKNNSTGLGLFLTKELINRHNGNIWIESEKGVGTIVYILI